MKFHMRHFSTIQGMENSRRYRQVISIASISSHVVEFSAKSFLAGNNRVYPYNSSITVAQMGSCSLSLKLVVPSLSQMMRCLGIKARRRVMGMILGLNTSILVTKRFVTPCRLNVWYNSAALQFLESTRNSLSVSG